MPAFAQQNSFQPGQLWNDVQGNPINAHGGGLLFYNGLYYWFGEIKKGPTTRVAYVTSWENYRTAAGGVSCYSSADLHNWKFEGIALSPNQGSPNHDLHTSKVIERPKVIYNKKTRQFVMWMHLDYEDYSYARTGVAVSDKVTGPFRFLKTDQLNGQESRDMTLFQDEDEKAYIVYASEDNASIHINLLSDDYLRPSNIEKRILVNKHREAPIVIKHQKKYYLFTSGCTGWKANALSYAIATHPLSEWYLFDNPCIGSGATNTFNSQGTFMIPMPGKDNAFIFLADRWNQTDLQDSRYVWLPMRFHNGIPKLYWADAWDTDYFGRR
ncbi:MAG: glycoside hydrolase family 43 protein [Chitinophagaceae bacterium]